WKVFAARSNPHPATWSSVMPSPRERSPERLRRHYEVEKALADRLKATNTPAERAPIYATMYAELFAQVPDHPRWTAQQDPVAAARQVQRLLDMLRADIDSECDYVEFGAGTGALAFAIAARVRSVRIVEIADQLPRAIERPRNLELILYDG